ncbi:MAG: 6-bladed beta-propeller [Gemmatimonadota bacterium]
MRSSALLPAACLVLLPALAACGGDARAAGPVVRDSAGVRIVENSAPAWKEGQGWRLSAEPALDIGMVEGPPEYQFGRVTGAVRLGDGTVVVADNQSRNLRSFDRTGRHLRTIGREGGGPGEFMTLGSLAAHGDSLVVGDYDNRRVSVFAPDGKLVRTVPLDAGGTEAFIRTLGPFRDGSVLLASENITDQSGLSRDSVTYLRLGPAGGSPRQLGRFPGDERFTQAQEGGPVNTGPRAFGRSAAVAAVPDGFFYGSSDRLEIGRYDESGKLLRLVRAPHSPRPVTPADVESFKEVRRRVLQDPRRARLRPLIEKSLAAMPYPETMPAHGEIRADPAGGLWVSDFRVSPDDAGRWTVFDPEGRMLGTVATPARFRVFDVGTDYVLGVWRDDMDVEHVRMYSLEKPGAGE